MTVNDTKSMGQAEIKIHRHNPLFILEESGILDNYDEKQIVVAGGLIAKNKYAEEHFDLAVGTLLDPKLPFHAFEENTYTIPAFNADTYNTAKERIVADILISNPGGEPNSRWLVKILGEDNYTLFQTDEEKGVVDEKYFATDLPHLRTTCPREISRIERILKQFH